MAVFRTILHGMITTILGMQLVAAAVACPICIGFPRKTDADVLLECHCVLLGRPDPSNLFQYAPGPLLKGTYDGSDFELLVDSATQRALEARPECHVLLIQESPKGPWRNLGWMTPAYEALVHRILQVGPTWIGPDAVKHRIDFFVPLLGHNENRIGELAYLELGRAPYPLVRALGKHVPRDAFAPMLQEQRYLEWRGLAILLLAQSDSESDRRRIREAFQAAQQYAIKTNLAAWATAAIEVDRDAAMDQIEETYLGNCDRSRDELQSIFTALSIHGSRDDSEMRDRVVACYTKLVKHFPEFAPQVAQDLAAWNRPEAARPVEAQYSRATP